MRQFASLRGEDGVPPCHRRGGVPERARRGGGRRPGRRPQDCGAAGDDAGGASAPPASAADQLDGRAHIGAAAERAAQKYLWASPVVRRRRKEKG